MKGMNYHDYIWDLGGTLLDNYEISTQAFVQTLAFFNLPGEHDAVYQKLRESTAIAVATFAPNQPQFLQEYKQNEAVKLAQPIWCLGAKEILAKIVASGARNFLVSHRDQQVNQLLRNAGLLDYFTEVVTASNGFARKPNPESLLYLKDKYDISSGLVIGDRNLDKQAGQAAGFDTLLVDGRKNLLEIVA
ncbi:UNVERIFIED_CONTAM: hydrolase [Streptococcus canis]|uniref:Phosphatase n=2 Tax=Streptococcus canis TaxID=1329 RepID=A0AAV3FS80_STRCB|nr:hydrolase [Streptococcus canis]EIQ81594.1 phosphatase [Streptococcus canis FSL Z3-227]MDV5987833.1 hydrolase [Streptococcus canis]MDV5994235.1 hydrolase [Streptococcus canis]MDV6000720.1 hydrolase [Streptococcus canis]MDV6021916.1 hydrolase [Streptococcus canis]